MGRNVWLKLVMWDQCCFRNCTDRHTRCGFLKAIGEIFLLGDRQRHFQVRFLSQILASFFKESDLILAFITADCLSSPEMVILAQRMMLLWSLWLSGPDLDELLGMTLTHP